MKRIPIAALIDRASNAPIPADTQLFGIEVEVEGCEQPDSMMRDIEMVKDWRLVADHSLRDNGAEFVSRILKKSETGPAVDTLYKTWKAWKLKSSVRCGIHVHMNCLDKYVDQLPGIFATYAIVEPLLYSYCGDIREENIYCVPWYRSSHQPTLLSNGIMTRGPRAAYNIRHAISVLCKYSGLFAGPLVRFGTIEFRHAPTWNKPEKLKVWLDMVNGIVDYGSKRPAEDVLNAWHNNAKLMLGLVFGDNAKKLPTNAVELIEGKGCLSVAEKFVPPKQRTGAEWQPPTLHVQGEGTKDYAESPEPEDDTPKRRNPEPVTATPEYNPYTMRVNVAQQARQATLNLDLWQALGQAQEMRARRN